MGIERREKHSWRQGSQVDAASLLDADLIRPDQQDRPMVVITHDCDIQSDKLEQIEILYGNFTPKICGDHKLWKKPSNAAAS